MGNTESSQQSLSFHFILHKEEANQFLQEAEQRDLYLAECRDNKANSKARQSSTYAANHVSFDDGQHYQQWLQDAIPALPSRLRSDLGSINIIPLMYSADGGMPHTRPYNMICVPHLKHLESMSTLTHELWHVHQRNYQSAWKTIFAKLGWTEWTGTLPPSLEENRRYNPDTIDSPLWIYQNKWVPLPIFTDISNPVLGNVDIWFYHADKKYHAKTIPPSLAMEFPDLPPSAYEHPRELTAYLLAEPRKYRSTSAWNVITSVMPGCE